MAIFTHEQETTIIKRIIGVIFGRTNGERSDQLGNKYQTNTKVEWDWGDGTASGYIREIFREKVTRTIKGTEVTRDGSDDDPAYIIEQEDGDRVLKLHSEIRKAS